MKQADARHIPTELSGVLTLFSAFHHFRPDDTLAILRDARDRGQPICIFRGNNRRPLPIILTVLVPILVLVMTPRIRPLR
jgi:hypothetical protein